MTILSFNFGRDAGGNAMISSLPAAVALEETYDATVSSSTALTLNVATTLLEITAIDKPIFYKWGGTAASTDFDGIVPANTSKLVPVPNGQTSIQFIEEAATAKLAVVEF